MPSVLNNYYYVVTQSFWPLGGDHANFSAETISNGWQLYNYLRSRNFSLEAACGIIGNATSESTGLNPGQEENIGAFTLERGGLGFIQWTEPRQSHQPNKLYAASPNQWFDGALQAQMIADEVDPSTADGSYYQSSSYPQYYLPNAQFMAYNGHDLEFITKVYFYSRERGTWSSARVSDAEEWYRIFTGTEPPTPPGPGPGPHPPVTFSGSFMRKRQNYKKRRIL